MSPGFAPLGALVLAVAGLAVSAIAQHDACTAAGYRLAAARREALDLRRRLAAAEQGLALVRAPEAVLARAAGMGLDLDYPEQMRTPRLSGAERADGVVAGLAPRGGRAD